MYSHSNNSPEENEDPKDRTPRKRPSQNSLFERVTSEVPLENSSNTPKKQRHSILRQSFNEANVDHTERQLVIDSQLDGDNQHVTEENTSSTVSEPIYSAIISNRSFYNSTMIFPIQVTTPKQGRRGAIDLTHSREEISTWRRPSETPMDLERNYISPNITPNVMTGNITTTYNTDFTSLLTANNEASNQRRLSNGSPRPHEFEDLNYSNEHVTIPSHNAVSPGSSPSRSKPNSVNASRRSSINSTALSGQMPNIQIITSPSASLNPHDDSSQMVRRLSIQKELTTSMVEVSDKLEQYKSVIKPESSQDPLGVPAPQVRRRSSATVEDIADLTTNFGSNPLKKEPLIEPEEKAKHCSPKINEPKPLKEFEAAMLSRGFRQLEHFPVTPQIKQLLTINRTLTDQGIKPNPNEYPDREPVEDLFMKSTKFQQSSCKGFRNHLFEKDGKVYACSTLKVSIAPDALDASIKTANTMTFKPIKDGVTVFVLALTFNEDRNWELNHRTAALCDFGHPGLMTSEENHASVAKKEGVSRLTTSKQEGVNPAHNENNNNVTVQTLGDDSEMVNHHYKHLVAAGEQYYLESEGGIILINDKTGRCSNYLRELGLNAEPILESYLGHLYSPSVTAKGSVYYRLKNVPSEFERHLDLAKTLIDRGLPYHLLSPDIKKDIKLHHFDETYQQKENANKEKYERFQAQKKLLAQEQQLLQTTTTTTTTSTSSDSLQMDSTSSIVDSMNSKEGQIEQQTTTDSVTTTSNIKSTASSELIAQIDVMGLDSGASSAFHRNHLYAQQSKMDHDQVSVNMDETLPHHQP